MEGAGARARPPITVAGLFHSRAQWNGPSRRGLAETVKTGSALRQAHPTMPRVGARAWFRCSIVKWGCPSPVRWYGPCLRFLSISLMRPYLPLASSGKLEPALTHRGNLGRQLFVGSRANLAECCKIAARVFPALCNYSDGGCGHDEFAAVT